MRKIKICHIASVDITVKFLLLSQLEFLVKEGCDVYVVCSSGKWIKDIENSGIKVKTIKIKRKISPFSDLVALWELFWFFKKEKFDIVHTHTPKPGLLGQMAAKMAGVPVVINTIHGLYFGNKFSKRKKNFYLLIEKISAKFSNLIFSQNKEDLKTLLDLKITKPEVVKYLGNGIDIAKFDCKRFPAEFIAKKKKELNLPEDQKIIGVVGRLVKEKGYMELFFAFKKILNVFPQTLLLIVGPEDAKKADSLNRNAVSGFGIKNNVLFLGERTDLDEIYPLMDIFVLASHREGFPRSIIEASACSVPVVATDIRGCKEAVENNKTGILVPLGNIEKLSEAIIYLMENPEKAKDLGKNGRQKAEKEFDEKFVFEKIKNEYERFSKNFKKDF